MARLAVFFRQSFSASLSYLFVKRRVDGIEILGVHPVEGQPQAFGGRLRDLLDRLGGRARKR